jgi:hypothetical protein
MGEMALFNKIMIPNLLLKETYAANNKTLRLAHFEHFFLESFGYAKNGVHEEKMPFTPRLMLRFLYGNFKLRTRYGYAKGK